MPAVISPEALASARAGEGWAYERIYKALAPPVAGYLRAQGIDDPDGATNDVFLRAFRRIDRFDGDADRLRSWVFAIAHNLVVDRRRFAARRPRTQPVEDLPERPAGDAEHEALAHLAEGRLLGVLGLLSPDQRDVVVLRFVLDCSLEEVAALTERSVGAVKALQHRALASLRGRLEEIWPEAVSPAAAPTFTEA